MTTLTQIRRAHLAVHLARTLIQIEASDTDCREWEGLVFAALAAAVQLGYKAGIGFYPGAPTWPVVFIELPSGQVSWRVPWPGFTFDGHSSKERNDRCARYREVACQLAREGCLSADEVRIVLEGDDFLKRGAGAA